MRIARVTFMPVCNQLMLWAREIMDEYAAYWHTQNRTYYVNLVSRFSMSYVIDYNNTAAHVDESRLWLLGLTIPLIINAWDTRWYCRNFQVCIQFTASFARKVREAWIVHSSNNGCSFSVWRANRLWGLSTSNESETCNLDGTCFLHRIIPRRWHCIIQYADV